MSATRYMVRRARPSERGRWVICENRLPNAVLSDGFLTRRGATNRATSWAAKHDAAERTYPVG